MVADIAKPKLRTRAKQVSLDILTRTKLRNLYLVRGLTYSEIAKECGVSVSVVTGFIARSKLREVKKEYLAKSIADHDARTRTSLSEISEAIATQSEEIALSGLERAGKAVVSRDPTAAKDFQSWTGGVRNLAQVARLARADAPIEASGSISISLFNVRGEAPVTEPKQVQPIEAEVKKYISMGGE